MSAEVRYTLLLISTILCDTSYVCPPLNFDFNKFYLLVKSHDIASIIYYAIKEHKDDFPKDIYEKILKKYKLNLYKETHQDTEASCVFKLLNDNKIKYLPIKGYVIKNLYKSPDMRSMADLDILVPEDKMHDIDKLVTNAGFKLSSKGEKDDAYFKPPFVTVEFHKNLILHNDMATASFGSWERSKKSDKNEHEYELSHEDSYIYLIAHMATHFHMAGCGIRFVTDVFVYLKSYAEGMDWDYINSELEKCGLLKFENEVKALSDVWFDGKASNEFYDAFTVYIVQSQSYGTFLNNSLHMAAVEKNYSGKNRRILRMIFPDKEYIGHAYPVVKKYPITLPVFWVVRWLRTVFKNKKNVSHRISAASETDREAVDNLKKIYNRLGLDS